MQRNGWIRGKSFFSNTNLAMLLDIISEVHGVATTEAFFNNLFAVRNTHGAPLNTYCKFK